MEVLWQCGKYYKKGIDEFMEAHKDASCIRYSDFIGRMDLAYAIADVVISRSGASSISEICAAHKAAIFVPSPNVAEDHQTHNAMALVRKDAALMVKDSEAQEKVIGTALGLLADGEKISAIEANAGAMAKTNAAQEICDEIYKLLEKK